ncbi:MAG TPA: efflux RND transporter periplasmic adaptor subunit [Candidatus Polarisedimenticolia bacterium]|jgi:membrane fusion protein (multidrug efflux system)|nr:efflux RND transporter periplasmic adaptor subunit [Candidatus Polarisedimenticolia bacterium]
MTRSTVTIAVAAALAAVSLCACKDEAAPEAKTPEVPVVRVLQRDTPITAERVGQIYGSQDTEIRARVAGFLQGMHFKEGTNVRKGDLLYTIDPSEQQQTVAKAEGDLASAKTRLVKAESDVKRYRPLAEMHAVSQADLDAAVAEEGAARGQVDAAQASLRFSKISLGYTRISSPIDGLIGMTQAKVGDYVGQSPNPIVLNTVSNVASVQVRFAITERDYLDLMRKFGPPHPDDKERRMKHDNIELLLADGSVYPQKGSLDFADRQIDPSTGTLRLQASFPNPDAVLRPGQYARVRIVIDTRKGALLVPQRAIQELQGQQLVSIVGPDDTVVTKTIQTGPRIGSLVVVENGLQPQDRVVLAGAQKIRPGGKVVPKEVSAEETVPAAPGAANPPAPAPPASH